jgi:DNA excision repair protein ERCC-6-like
LKASHRVILSGTPIQNNLMEMWALYDYIFEGLLLGPSRIFSIEFAKRIEKGNHQDASAFEKKVGIQASDKLKEIVGPYFLRREKGKVLKDIGPGAKKISQKNDLIVWITLSKPQLKLYKDYVESPEVKAVLNQTSSALASLTILKQICDHPLLLKKDQFEESLRK